MKEEDLEVSKVYVGVYPNGKIIFKYGGEGLDKTRHRIIDMSNTYRKHLTSCCTHWSGRILREATFEEEQWLEACIRAGKTIPRNEVSLQEYQIF